MSALPGPPYLALPGLSLDLLQEGIMPCLTWACTTLLYLSWPYRRPEHELGGSRVLQPSVNLCLPLFRTIARAHGPLRLTIYST